MLKNKPLLWQIYLSYLLILLVSLVTVTLYNIDSLGRFYRDRTSEGLLARAGLIRDQLSDLYRDGQTERIDQMCKKLGAESLTRITFITDSGLVLGDSDENIGQMDNHADRPEVKQALAGQVGTKTRPSDTLETEMMYVAVPVIQDGRVKAVVRTSVSLEEVDNALHTILMKIGAAGIIIAIGAAVLSLAASRRITEPLGQLTKGARRFAGGDLSHRLDVPESPEIAALARAMNRMAMDLQQRIEAIITNRNEQEAILSSMAEGVLAVDADWRIISMNRTAADLIGIDAEQAYGKNLQDVVGRTELCQCVKQVLASAEPVEGQVVLEEDNSQRFVLTRGTVLQDASGEKIGAVVVLNDVTRLRRLEKVRRDFVANVSHELRTPITSIKGFIETLLDGAMDRPEDARRFLEIISRQTGRLNAIINDLLTLSRIEQQTEKTQIELQEHSVRSVIDAAVQLCQLKAGDKNVNIETNCDEILRIRINPHLLEQAVVNLLDNAVKYSERDSTVQINVNRENKFVTIDVVDHGCGIEAIYLPRLFERFYRVDKARSRKLGGTGLGLAIVKHIAQAHDGRVTVKSEPNKGSTFTIRLPAG